MSYEVLYNSCYGGFSFPEEFIKEAFRRFPPESEEGKQLWKPTGDYFIQADDPVPVGKWIHRIVNTEDFCHGYKWIYYERINDKGKPEEYQSHISKPSNYCTKDFKTYYFVHRSYSHAWRTLPVIIAMAREFNLLHTKHRHTEMRIAKVPADYDFRIREYDGMETVCITCPTEAILADLVRMVRVGNSGDAPAEPHPLTKRLLDGAPLRDILYPKVEFEDGDEDSEDNEECIKSNE